MKEQITVIIPTYKRYDLLERAIKSVLNQTYSNIELIVVDDNYPDSFERKETEKIMKKFPNVIYIKNKKNLGGGITRNVGIKNSTSNLIAFLDDDDEFMPTKIEKQYELYKKLNNKNIAMIYCYKDDYDEKGKFLTTFKRDYEGIPLYEHMLYFIVTTSCWFCDKKILQKVGMFDNISSQQDATLLVKILASGYEIYRVPESLVKFYVHSKNNGITTVSDKYIKDIEQYRDTCRNYYDKLNNRQIRNVEHKFMNQLFNLHLKNNNVQESKNILKEMIKLNFFKIANFKNIIKILKYRKD